MAKLKPKGLGLGQSRSPVLEYWNSLNRAERYFVYFIVLLLIYAVRLEDAPNLDEPIQIGTSSKTHLQIVPPPPSNVKSHDSHSFAPRSVKTKALESSERTITADVERTDISLENMFPQYPHLTPDVISTANRITFPSDRDLQVIFLGLKNRPLWFFPQRKHGYEAHRFNVKTLARFENLYFMYSRINSNVGYYEAFDAWMCLLKYYCFNKETYIRLESSQGMTNRVLGSKEIWSTKISYCSTLREALRATTKEGRNWIGTFTFMCWVLPTNYPALQNDTLISNGKYIVKPAAAQAGQGIYLHDVKTHGLKGLDGKVMRKNPAVVQPYLTNPYLINGKKWDMRIYVAVTSVTPLRAYMHSEGFIRFAFEDYSNDEEKEDEKNVFLTNLSVNNKKAKTEDLTWVFSELRDHFKDKASFIFSRIDLAIGRMLLTSEKSFRKYYDSNVDSAFSCENCYHILGIDVIIDEDLNAYVIEINGNPTLNFKAEKLNDEVSQLEEDVVRMMYNNDQIYEQNTEGKSAMDIAVGVMEDISRVKESGDDLFEWLTKEQISYLVRSKREQQELGGFRRIYPVTTYCEDNKDENEWTAFMKFLRLSEERIRFHDLLTRLEKIRVQRCIKDSVECSNEIHDKCNLKYIGDTICNLED
mmetsp:Transcript_24485/g.29909  ORF Transcript_24485/g.29909 Transcript_24485/m.29909 type:complete len:644 (-) Transcript_24485:122-2053(-)|eukprot:CAMPEP_0204829938 /NCGR_PEP_ID=MMETSP1346-20131115/8233_1 /ASSEMBLY_ACC=CAM_ASM_000771 /TAXON_ID=215587 /ORGANISM="Aplanochytrium stocchinoi, Strain GSBS06" /LENGTH=643 /DNA_ID=CAMNT_0051960033 /DNA_START=104 /DNA_END=2035 /DNA_ORIENTATION=-